MKSQNTSLDIIICFADGCCPRNGRDPLQSGYGVYFPNGEYPNASVACSAPHTNNKAELQAIIHVLNLAKDTDKHFIVYSDSLYCVKAYNRETHNTKNKDLIDTLYELSSVCCGRVEVKWCKSHQTGDSSLESGNRMADYLAHQSIETF
jgi:ribonuclease HI